MAYKKEQLFEICKRIIEENRLFFIADVVAYAGISKYAFYEHFPVESDEYKELDLLLKKNKALVKVSLRNKWYNSDNSTAQIVLYKLIASEDERRKITGSKSNQAEEVQTQKDDAAPGSEFILPNGTKLII